MPLHKKDLQALVADAHPEDGIRVRETVFGRERELHLAYYQHGQPDRRPWMVCGDLTELVWRARDPDDEALGDLDRTKLLLEAIGRYVNTGGPVAKLNQLVHKALAFVAGASEMQLPGLYLIDSAVNTDGVYEHVFASQDSQWALRWVEGQFFDVTSLLDIRNDAQREEEAQPRVEFGSEGGADLPGGPGPGGPPPDEGGSTPLLP